MNKEYKNACENVVDCNGKVIVNHDVCKVVSTGEVVIVEIGINEHHKTLGLAAINDVIGLKDWLDVYPDGALEVIGNMAVSYEEENNHE
ncbi:hypothetical protein ACOJIU_04270 [Carnobacterium maltaromaticum]|uniref:hypothetical protein n=1 Tax=Carnobacterium maltaromaticum TaxID=2751 RepID=UPI003B983625